MRKLHFYLTCVFFMSVAASSTRKTSKVWDYFELEGNGKVLCKLCNVRLTYNNFTGAMRNHIQCRHVCVSLEASQSQMSIMSYTTTCRCDPRSYPRVYSSKRRPTSVVLRDLQALLETVCLLVVISLCACDFSSSRALFLLESPLVPSFARPH